MPLSVVQRLSLGELTPTAITLQMADRSMAQPEGILEDVLVKVGKFVFPVDFFIMQIEEDTQVVTPRISGPTRSANPNRFPGRETQDWDSLPYFIFFFKSQLAPVGMAHIL